MTKETIEALTALAEAQRAAMIDVFAHNSTQSDGYCAAKKAYEKTIRRLQHAKKVWLEPMMVIHLTPRQMAAKRKEIAQQRFNKYYRLGRGEAV